MNEWLTPVIEAFWSHFGGSYWPVVWEVGSRDGKDAVELAERIYIGEKDRFWDEAMIVAMEPNPEQAKIIREAYPKIRVIQEAASDKTGTADFIVYEGDEGAVGSSSLNLDWKEDEIPGHIIGVGTVRLEDVIDDEIIDIMKIDVESYSLQVLHGLGDKLNQIRVLHVETEDWAGSDVAVKDYLTGKGWKLVDERQQYSGMPDLTWANASLVGQKYR